MCSRGSSVSDVFGLRPKERSDSESLLRGCASIENVWVDVKVSGVK